jgi:hypothetical protein
MHVTISGYDESDSAEAVALERMCPQGGALLLRFRRPTFHARASVYEERAILCARSEERIVGVAAGAAKAIAIHGETVRATYGFDLRVHPSFRRYGTAQRLAGAVIETLGPAQCVYALVAGMNERALRFTRQAFGARTAIPLTYMIIPVSPRTSCSDRCLPATAGEVRAQYLAASGNVEFIPSADQSALPAHVGSFTLDGGNAGASVWCNDGLLQEEIVRLPPAMHALHLVSRILTPMRLMPAIPGPGEAIKSWLLYDVFARGSGDLRRLIAGLMREARVAGRQFLYLLVRSDDPMVWLAQEAGIRFLTVPYVFLAKGETVPDARDRIYIDVRDL